MRRKALEVRPYRLLCAVCALGGGAPPGDAEIRCILEMVREDPDVPVSVVCNAGDVYVYHDPGLAEDTPEGREYNRKRDLDILQRLDLAPASTLPARTLFHRVLKAIETTRGICSYGDTTAGAWMGCCESRKGAYEKGRERGIAAIIPPRAKEEMAREKMESVRELYAAKRLTIRPHILMCVVCHFGRHGTEPIEADNIVEFLDVVRRNPDIPVTLVPGADRMICAPCPAWVPELNACVNVAGSGGLSNEKRDLDLLQRLGLVYGSTLKARDLYNLLFERVPTTVEICRRDNPSLLSVWWDNCGERNRARGDEGYETGRAFLIEEFRQKGVSPAPS